MRRVVLAGQSVAASAAHMGSDVGTESQVWHEKQITIIVTVAITVSRILALNQFPANPR